MAAADDGMDLKDRILEVLSNAISPLKAVDVARQVGKSTAKEVNKYLYELKKNRKVMLSQEQPPMWELASETSPSDMIGSSPRVQGGKQAAKPLIEDSTRIESLPYGFFQAASLLVITVTVGRGWEKFAGELGFTMGDIALFRKKSNPVKAVITEWQTKQNATVGNFINIMRKMDRHDVLCKLLETLGDQMSPEVKKQIDEAKSENSKEMESKKSEEVKSEDCKELKSED